MAIDQHEAGAAVVAAATEARAFQVQGVTQDVEQRRVGLGIDIMCLPVDPQADPGQLTHWSTLAPETLTM
jgi:hypothetical protein